MPASQVSQSACSGYLQPVWRLARYSMGCRIPAFCKAGTLILVSVVLAILQEMIATVAFLRFPDCYSQMSFRLGLSLLCWVSWDLQLEERSKVNKSAFDDTWENAVRAFWRNTFLDYVFGIFAKNPLVLSKKLARLIRVETGSRQMPANTQKEIKTRPCFTGLPLQSSGQAWWQFCCILALLKMPCTSHNPIQALSDASAYASLRLTPVCVLLSSTQQLAGYCVLSLIAERRPPAAEYRALYPQRFKSAHLFVPPWRKFRSWKRQATMNSLVARKLARLCVDLISEPEPQTFDKGRTAARLITRRPKYAKVHGRGEGFSGPWIDYQRCWPSHRVHEAGRDEGSHCRCLWLL